MLQILVFALLLRFGQSAVHPVIFVPGDGGSQIEARLNKSVSSTFSLCEKTSSDFFTLYLNIESLLPLARSCFSENAKLVYDQETHNVRNADGVETRIPGWGNTSGIEYLSSIHRSQTLYFGAIIQSLVDSLGYERGKSVRGAPYDFRMLPYGVDDYFDQLTALIEETSVLNGNQSVVLIGHSFGGNLIHAFLTRRDAAWKQRYVRGVISLGTPFGGAMKTVLLQTSGDNFGVVIEPRSALRDLERTFASIAALLPSPSYWNDTEPLIVVQSSAVHGHQDAAQAQATYKTYTAADYERLFSDLNISFVFSMFNDTRAFMNPPDAPHVEWHCVHGTQMPTPARLEWTGSRHFPSDYPTVVHADGDGTVNVRSLRGCLHFRARQNESVPHVTFTGVDHLRMLHDADVVDYVRSYMAHVNKRGGQTASTSSAAQKIHGSRLKYLAQSKPEKGPQKWLARAGQFL